MMATNDQTISTLNNLIETCRDGEQGFRQAAEGIQDFELRTLFTQYSQQRRQFAEELEAEVNRLGGKPETSGSLAGAAHRGWMNIKEAITGKDDEKIISECERGEDVAKASYQKALADAGTLPANAQSIVQRQSTQVKAAHDRIRALEKASQSA